MNFFKKPRHRGFFIFNQNTFDFLYHFQIKDDIEAAAKLELRKRSEPEFNS